MKTTIAAALAAFSLLWASWARADVVPIFHLGDVFSGQVSATELTLTVDSQTFTAPVSSDLLLSGPDYSRLINAILSGFDANSVKSFQFFRTPHVDPFVDAMAYGTVSAQFRSGIYASYMVGLVTSLDPTGADAYAFSGTISNAFFNEGIPEPSTWVLMLIGFAGIVLLARRTPSPDQPALSLIIPCETIPIAKWCVQRVTRRVTDRRLSES